MNQRRGTSPPRLTVFVLALLGALAIHLPAQEHELADYTFRAGNDRYYRVTLPASWSLAEELADRLGAHAAFVPEGADPAGARAAVVAVWNDGYSEFSAYVRDQLATAAADGVTYDEISVPGGNVHGNALRVFRLIAGDEVGYQAFISLNRGLHLGLFLLTVDASDALVDEFMQAARHSRVFPAR